MSEKLYTIPKFSRYQITKTGRVFSRISQKWLKPSLNGPGYLNYVLYGDEDNRITIGVHRVLCYVFKDLDLADAKMVVTHINGDKTDNRLENLICLTYQQNKEFAGQRRATLKCAPIIAYNYRSNKTYRFPSIFKCAKFLKVSDCFIRFRMKKHQGVYKHWQIKRAFDERPFLSVKEQKRVRENIGNAMVILESVPDGRLTTYKSKRNLSIALGCSPTLITEMFKRPKEHIHVLDGKCFRLHYKGEYKPLPMVKDVYMAIAEQGDYVISCYNESNHHVFFNGHEAARFMGLKPSTLHARLQSNYQKVYSDGYRYGYYIHYKCPYKA